jgi:Uma2 family endonuclease
MQIDLKPQPNAIQRWQELLADPELARLPHRVETDRLGRIILNDLPTVGHSRRATDIMLLLAKLLPAGQTLLICPLSTADGVKAIDVAWISPEYANELESKDPPVLERAPEICVEVLSPSNSDDEITEKRALYFEAGAAEVWICGLDGKIAFYAPGRFLAVSKLCPQFPDHV